MEVSESVLHLTLLSLGVAARMNDDDSDDVWIVLQTDGTAYKECGRVHRNVCVYLND